MCIKRGGEENFDVKEMSDNLFSSQSAQPSFYIYLRQLFRAPFGLPKPIAKRDFGTLDYFQRTMTRTLDNYFKNDSVKHIALPNPMPLPISKLGSARILRNGQFVEGETLKGV